jgi:hypothetical protein
MSEALQYFLDEQTLIKDIDFPDTGIDNVFMLKQEDWTVLLSKWDNYSNDWKSAMSYFAGFVFLEDSAELLYTALSEKDEKIKLQALFSIHESIMAELDHQQNKAPNKPAKTGYKFSKENKDLVLNEIENHVNDFEFYPELEELQDYMKAVKV